MRDRMLRGELYIADDADSEAEFGRVQELLAEFNGSPGAWDERDALLRRTVRHVGEDVVVRPPSTATTARSASATGRSSTSTR